MTTLNAINTRRITADMVNDPFLIGFDSILNKMHSINRPSSNYPPYNLIKIGETTYIIELAVAGCDEEDFDIDVHESVLTIRADVTAKDSAVNYIHKSIAARSFERKFTLADTIKVEGVFLLKGMLSITLENHIPEENKPRKIAINKSNPQFIVEQ
jgi:molecular chaperone IbpA